MKRLIVITLIGLLAWQGYARYERSHSGDGTAAEVPDLQRLPGASAVESELDAPTDFRCDGRTYCSQMTSCAEATFFLKNCPGAKMDGNNDGVPCEQQWCR